MDQAREHSWLRAWWRPILMAAIVVLAIGAVVLWHRVGSDPAHAAARAQKPMVPVTVAVAGAGDVPIFLAGLGTVQASNTTAVHTQVDGKLQSVNFVEGQEVHSGDVLVRIDARFYQAALDQAKAKKAEDIAQVISAQKDLVRFQTLAVKNFATQQSVDQQQAKVDQLKATIDADEAAIESAQTQLDYTTITAPTDGRIGVRQVDPGNIVHATDATPIVMLTQTRPISVVFTLPESSLASVRRAMAQGPVSVLAYDQDDAQQIGSGTLLLVDNEIDQTTSTIKLKAMFPNEDEILWPGEFVHARLLVDTRRNAVTVPAAAVQRGPNGVFAWVLQADATVKPQPIDIGPTQNDTAVVNSGLAAGDVVIVNGQSRLQAGTRVDAKSAPIPSAESGAP